MKPDRRPVRLLASVTNEGEASLAVACGADIIDCKDPAAGALGALPLATVARIVGVVGAHCPVSATIGDLAAEPDLVAEAAGQMAETGVDFIKIGFFPGGDTPATIARLGLLRLGSRRLVGVLLADRELELKLIEGMARAGFAGVMLDTADKASGALPDFVSDEVLGEFVASVRRYGMLAGLAGSLRLGHIPALLELGPDILGFRGALCAGNRRMAGLDPDAIRAIRAAIPAIHAPEALAS